MSQNLVEVVRAIAKQIPTDGRIALVAMKESFNHAAHGYQLATLAPSAEQFKQMVDEFLNKGLHTNNYSATKAVIAGAKAAIELNSTVLSQDDITQLEKLYRSRFQDAFSYLPL